VREFKEIDMKSTASGTIGLFALAVIASPSALAADLGGYVGGSIGGTKAHFDDATIAASVRAPGPVTTSLDSDDKDWGFKLFGGYQFHRNFAVELGYFDLGKFNFSAITAPAGTQSGEFKVRGGNLDLVGSLPITEKFSALGRVGGIYAKTKDSFAGTGAVAIVNPNPRDSDFNYKYGLGLQYDFNPNLAVRAEVERHRVSNAVSGKDNVDLFSIGLVYRFARAPAPVQRAPEPVAPPPAPPPPPPKAVKPPPPPEVVTPPPAPPPPAPVEKPIRKDRN
jgi:OOP family OmpA-OmpF porin